MLKLFRDRVFINVGQNTNYREKKMTINYEESLTAGLNYEKVFVNELRMYKYAIGKKLALLAFKGKKRKPIAHYSFATEEHREEFVKKMVGTHLTQVTEKEERRMKRNAFVHSLQVGDILASSWGYEQTNVDFYQVVALKGKKSVALRAIGHEMVAEDGFMQGKVVAKKDEFKGKEFTKKVSEGNYVKMSSYEYANKWDGEPKRVSWYG